MRRTATSKPTLSRGASLASGIGAADIGLARCGIRTVFAADIDHQARSTYALNHGFLPHGDLFRVKAPDVPAHDVCVLTAPCTTFSGLGNREGTDDERGTLHREMLRIVKHAKPKLVLVENVPGMELVQDGAAVKEIADGLAALGYFHAKALLNAGDFSVPQARERLFIAAFSPETGVESFTFPTGPRTPCELADILEPPDVAAGEIVKYDEESWEDEEARVAEVGAGRGRIGIGSVGHCHTDRVYSVRGHAPTLTAGNGGRSLGMGLYRIGGAGGVVRRLTPREAARAMGLPDTMQFPFAPSVTRQLLGNALVPQIITALATEAIKAIETASAGPTEKRLET